MAVSIETARKAVRELRTSPIALNRRIAAGVLSTFIDQQEKISNNSKNTDMRNFNDLTPAQKEQVINRFVLPDDHNNLQVDENLVPFARISGSLVSCTVKNNNFHVHGNTQNGR